MTLRFCDYPVLNYGKAPTRDADWRQRFPKEARPIATAPLTTSTPIEIYEADGQGWLAIHHKGAWQKLYEDRDDRDGTSQIRMTGETINNGVAWSPHVHKRRDD